MAEEKIRKSQLKSERRDVIRTKKAINDAYYELLFKKKHDKITVTDVIKEADISRGTFYAYYKDIPDLKSCFEDMVVSSIKETLSGYSLREIAKDPRPFVQNIIDRFADHRSAIYELIKKSEDGDILLKIKLVFYKAICESMDKDKREKGEVLTVCMLGAIVDAVAEWVVQEKTMDKEELTDIICNFISGGLNVFLKD